MHMHKISKRHDALKLYMTEISPLSILTEVKNSIKVSIRYIWISDTVPQL